MTLRDRTMALARQGYHFSDWLDQHTQRQASGRRASGTPLRLFGRRSLLLRGRDGVQLFYDDTRVRRRRGLPAAVAHNLYGKGSVHALDDLEHRDRKRLFLEVTGPEQVGDLAERVVTKWDVELDSWVRTGRGTVIPSATRVLGEAVQEWAGVPEPPVVMRRRARDLVQIVDNSMRPGLPWLRARWARHRADRWATGLIGDVRRGTRRPPVGSAAEVLAFARDRTGELLPARTAAVELLNVLRPTVAISYFAAFAALELETNPDLNDDCATGDPESVRTFSEEVRRMSPFVPLLAARSRCPFSWQGHRVRAGDRLLLDVYGTNRDPVAWRDGDTFDPGRFRSPNARHRADFVPQGGGPADTGHRCPGEGITLALLDEMIPRMARLDWRIHPEDRAMSLERLPARPEGGVRLLDVHRSHQPELLG